MTGEPDALGFVFEAAVMYVSSGRAHTQSVWVCDVCDVCVSGGMYAKPRACV